MKIANKGGIKLDIFNIVQFQEAGCKLIAGNDVVSIALVQEYGINSCTTGCHYYTNGNCKAYKILISNKPTSANNVLYTNTVREEAARLGISISEVRRRRSGIIS